jgi:hypothetical protein
MPQVEHTCYTAVTLVLRRIVENVDPIELVFREVDRVLAGPGRRSPSAPV